MLKKLALILLSSALLILTACSEEDLSDFQRNAVDPDFSVFTLVEGYPSLSYIWDNMDSDLVNDRLSETMDKYSDEFVRFSTIQSNIMRSNPEALVALVNKGGLAMDALLDEEEKYYYSPFVEVFYGDRGSKYQADFYALLERISNAETEGLRPSVMNIARTIVGYIIDTKDPADLNKFMNKAIGAMEDMEREDFVDLTKLLGKMLMSANYPMYLYETGHANEGELITDPDDIDSNSVNTGVGNMTAGLNMLLVATAEMLAKDQTLKDGLFDILDEVPALYSAKTDNGKDIAHVLVDLITNIETYFTPADSGETDAADYYADSDIYVNSDLKNTVKEMMPALQKLMLSSDKADAVINDPLGKGRSFVEIFMDTLKGLGWTSEYIDSLKMDEDLVGMIQYDGFGRDRLTNPAASNVSYLDHTVFTLMAASNFGYNDSAAGPGDGEGSGFNWGHGHGEANGGMITLNDCLIVQGVPEDATSGQTTYDLVLSSPKGHQTFRSSSLFEASERHQNRFYLNSSYPSNLLLSGQCIGDAGLPNGGRGIDTNNNGTPESGEADSNNFKWVTFWPYDGKGTGELNTARWSMGWIGRTCWNGEGPYYYGTPSETATPIEIEGKTYNAYMRPDGNIYAYIYKADESDPQTWEYVYPDDAKYDAPIEAAELALGKTKNYAEFRTNGGRYGGGYVAWDKQQLTVRMGATERGSFSNSTGSSWTTSETISSINGLGFSGVSMSEESGQVRIRNNTGPMAFVNDGNTGVYTTLYNMIWQDGTYSGATNHSVYVACNKYIVKSDSSVTVSIDDDVNVTLSFSAGQIYTIDELINYLKSELGSEYVQAIGSEGGNVHVYPNSKDNFKNDSWWQNFIGNDAPTIKKHFKLAARSNDYRINRITLTNNYGSAINDLFNMNLADGESYTIRSKGRKNRYKQKWNTDYYLFEINGKYYAPKSSGGLEVTDTAGCYEITELIPENPTSLEVSQGKSRECSSQEEAMHKNFHYLMQEKKMVYVIPMVVDFEYCLQQIEFVINCRIEANGVTGLMTARKYSSNYSDNGRWKKGHGYDNSTIPGDGRIAMDVYEVSGVNLMGIVVDEATMFASLGDGPVLPPVVGYNMAPVARMGYILENIDSYNSWEVGENFTQWSKRSKAFPLIISLMGTLRDLTYYEAPTDGSRTFNNSSNNRYPAKILTDNLLPALGKPMFYYQKSGQSPINCWKPRIVAADDMGDMNGYLRQVLGATDFSSYVPRYYKTLTNMLFESSAKSVDGLVPLMSKTGMTTKTIKLLNNLAHGDPAIYDNAAEYDPADSSTWGIKKKIAYALEQLTTGMKVTKGEAYSRNYVDDIYESWQYATGTSGAWTNVRDCDIVMDDMLDDLVDDVLADLPDSTQAVTDERLSSMGRVVEATLDNENVDTGEPITIKMDDGSGTLNTINVTVSNGLVSGSDVDGYGRFIPATGDIYFVLKDEPTGKITMSYSFSQDWQGFYDLFDDLGMFIESDSEYFIYDDLIQVMKSTLDAMTYDENLASELKGALYTLGKLFAYYNGDKWIYQGEEGFDFLFTMMKKDLPLLQRLMLDDSGDNIEAVLVLVNDLIRQDGVIDAVLDSVDAMNVTDAFEWREIFADLQALLKDPLMAEVGSDLWPTLADMMDDMSEAIEGSKGIIDTNGGSETSSALKEIYRDYGFQYNGH